MLQPRTPPNTALPKAVVKRAARTTKLSPLRVLAVAVGFVLCHPQIKTRKTKAKQGPHGPLPNSNRNVLTMPRHARKIERQHINHDRNRNRRRSHPELPVQMRSLPVRLSLCMRMMRPRIGMPMFPTMCFVLVLAHKFSHPILRHIRRLV